MIILYEIQDKKKPLSCQIKSKYKIQKSKSKLDKHRFDRQNKKKLKRIN